MGYLFGFVAVHGTYMANTYDFYKPKLDSEYPEVDGPLSISTYLTALDQAYKAFREKSKRRAALTPSKANGSNGHANGSSNGANGHSNGKTVSEESTFSLEDVDYPIFHSPYGKLVQKGHARLIFNDFLSNPSAPLFSSIPAEEASSLTSMSYEKTLSDKNVEKSFMKIAGGDFKEKVTYSMHCAKRCGNMYTASLYGGLASLIASVEPDSLKGKRLSMFAYGSGCAASFYTIRVKGDTGVIREKMDLLARLAAMKVVPCQEYVDSLKVCCLFSLNCLSTS